MRPYVLSDLNYGYLKSNPVEVAVIAVIPMLVNKSMNVDYAVSQFLGGTGLLIVVSVGLDLIQKIDSHLIMRNYSGLMTRR